MLDGILDQRYPYDPQYLCDRCDRWIDKMDDRPVLRLLFYPSVEVADRIRNADKSVTFCPDCQHRLLSLFGDLTLMEIGSRTDRTDVSPGCNRCQTRSDDTEGLVSGWGGIVGPRRWAARLCPRCMKWLHGMVDDIRTERSPYDGGYYRPPDLRRAEAAVETWNAADTTPATETFESLQSGDVVRIVAYRPGSTPRGVYLGMTGQVERVLAPLSDGPPAQVDVRTIEHEHAVPDSPRDDHWSIRSTDYGLRISYADTELTVSVLSILHRGK